MQPKRLAPVLAAIVALVAGGFTLAAVIHSGSDGTSARVEISIPGATPSTQNTTAPDVAVEVPRLAVRSAKASELGHHADLRSETPPGVPRSQLEANRRQQEALAQTDQLPLVTPLAATTQRGCTTRLVANRSSRRGVRPRILVPHSTISRNVPGWGDVFAIDNLFDSPSFAASSNYVIDDEGHCSYIVPESEKAWTQAAANPFAISVEMIAMDNPSIDGDYGRSAGLAKIGLVFHDAAQRWGIPLQRGLVSNCTVVRPGIVQHKDLGACGGGHVDITPYSVDRVIAAARSAGSLPKHHYASRTLCEGASGTDVQRLQGFLDRRLRNHGHPGLGRDGSYGPATERARHLVTYDLGFPRGSVRRPCASSRTQHFVRHPDKRPPSYKDRAKARAALR
jgi:hypothetical protein